MLQADGGTCTASITGAYVATVIALRKVIANKTASPRALKTAVATNSAGSEGKFIELQTPAEGEPFARESMDRSVNLARNGILQLFKIQASVL